MSRNCNALSSTARGVTEYFRKYCSAGIYCASSAPSSFHNCNAFLDGETGNGEMWSEIFARIKRSQGFFFLGRYLNFFSLMTCGLKGQSQANSFLMIRFAFKSEKCGMSSDLEKVSILHTQYR